MANKKNKKNKNNKQIVLREIELRSRSLSNRKFFRNRALLCYKLAYIKAHIPEEFEMLKAELCM